MIRLQRLLEKVMGVLGDVVVGNQKSEVQNLRLLYRNLTDDELLAKCRLALRADPSLNADTTVIRRSLAEGLARRILMLLGLGFEYKKADLRNVALGITAFARCPADLPPRSALYDEQVDAAIALLSPCVLQMDTGEGKTYAILPAAFALACKYHRVYIVCANDYLAWRDAQRTRSYWQTVGLTPGLGLTNRPGIDGSEWAHRVIYTTAESLRRKIVLDNVAITAPEYPITYGAALIDEADASLLDESDSSTNLVQSVRSQSFDWSIAIEIALDLDEEDIAVDRSDLTARLTISGEQKLLQHLKANGNQSIENYLLMRHIVEDSFVGLKVAEESVDYIIENRRIVPINRRTGRLEHDRDRDWQFPLEFKLGLPSRPRQVALHNINNSTLFRRFQHMAGLSGTVSEDAIEYMYKYWLMTFAIPRRTVKFDGFLPDRIYGTRDDAISATCEDVLESCEVGRPVMIGTQTIADAEDIYGALKAVIPPGIRLGLLTGKNDREMFEIFDRAGEPHSVLVVTQLAGRGIDIRLTDEARALDGMHLIGFSHNEESRLDKQFLGRVGRQSDPFTAYFNCSLDDPFMTLVLQNDLRKLTSKLMSDGAPLDSRFLSKRIVAAQRLVRLIRTHRFLGSIYLENADEDSYRGIKRWFDYLQIHSPAVDHAPNASAEKDQSTAQSTALITTTPSDRPSSETVNDARSPTEELDTAFLNHTVDHFLSRHADAILNSSGVLTRSEIGVLIEALADAIDVDPAALPFRTHELEGFEGSAARRIIKDRFLVSLADATRDNQRYREAISLDRERLKLLSDQFDTCRRWRARLDRVASALRVRVDNAPAQPRQLDADSIVEKDLEVPPAAPLLSPADEGDLTEADVPEDHADFATREVDLSDSSNSLLPTDLIPDDESDNDLEDFRELWGSDTEQEDDGELAGLNRLHEELPELTSPRVIGLWAVKQIVEEQNLYLQNHPRAWPTVAFRKVTETIEREGLTRLVNPALSDRQIKLTGTPETFSDVQGFEALKLFGPHADDTDTPSVAAAALLEPTKSVMQDLPPSSTPGTDATFDDEGDGERAGDRLDEALQSIDAGVQETEWMLSLSALTLSGELEWEDAVGEVESRADFAADANRAEAMLDRVAELLSLIDQRYDQVFREALQYQDTVPSMHVVRTPRRIASWTIQLASSEFLSERDRIQHNSYHTNLSGLQYHRAVHDGIISAWKGIDESLSARLISNLLKGAEPDRLDDLFWLHDNQDNSSPRRLRPPLLWQSSGKPVGSPQRDRQQQELINQFVDQKIATSGRSGSVKEASLRRILTDFLQRHPPYTLRDPQSILDAMTEWNRAQREHGVGLQRAKINRTLLLEFLAFLRQRNLVGKLPTIQTWCSSLLGRLKATLTDRTAILTGVPLLFLLAAFATLRIFACWMQPHALSGGAGWIERIVLGDLMQLGNILAPAFAGLVIGAAGARLFIPQYRDEIDGQGVDRMIGALVTVGTAVWMTQWMGHPSYLSFLSALSVFFVSLVIAVIVHRISLVATLQAGISVRAGWLACSVPLFLWPLIATETALAQPVVLYAALLTTVVLVWMFRRWNRQELIVVSAHVKSASSAQDAEYFRTCYQVHGDCGAKPHVFAMVIALLVPLPLGVLGLADPAATPGIAFFTPAVVYGLVVSGWAWAILSQRFSPHKWQKQLNEKRERMDRVDSWDAFRESLARYRNRAAGIEIAFLLTVLVGFAVYFWQNGIVEPYSVPVVVGSLFLFANQLRAFATQCYLQAISRAPLVENVIDLADSTEPDDIDDRWERMKHRFYNRFDRILVVLTLLITLAGVAQEAYKLAMSLLGFGTP